MTPKAGHTFTAGPVVSNGHTIRTADENNITRRRVATAHGPFGDAEKAANAELIAEAFNVAHETGLTPRQLAEQIDVVEVQRDIAETHRDELLAALKGAEEWLSGWASAEPYLTTIRAAIAKAEGGAA